MINLLENNKNEALSEISNNTSNNNTSDISLDTSNISLDTSDTASDTSSDTSDTASDISSDTSDISSNTSSNNTYSNSDLNDNSIQWFPNPNSQNCLLVSFLNANLFLNNHEHTIELNNEVQKIIKKNISSSDKILEFRELYLNKIELQSPLDKFAYMFQQVCSIKNLNTKEEIKEKIKNVFNKDCEITIIINDRTYELNLKNISLEENWNELEINWDNLQNVDTRNKLLNNILTNLITNIVKKNNSELTTLTIQMNFLKLKEIIECYQLTLEKDYLKSLYKIEENISDINSFHKDFRYLSFNNNIYTLFNLQPLRNDDIEMSETEKKEYNALLQEENAIFEYTKNDFYDFLTSNNIDDVLKNLNFTQDDFYFTIQDLRDFLTLIKNNNNIDKLLNELDNCGSTNLFILFLNYLFPNDYLLTNDLSKYKTNKISEQEIKNKIKDLVNLINQDKEKLAQVINKLNNFHENLIKSQEEGKTDKKYFLNKKAYEQKQLQINNSQDYFVYRLNNATISFVIKTNQESGRAKIPIKFQNPKNNPHYLVEENEEFYLICNLTKYKILGFVRQLENHFIFYGQKQDKSWRLINDGKESKENKNTIVNLLKEANSNHPLYLIVK